MKLGICLSQTILPKTRSVAVKGIIARVTTYFYARDKRQLITAFQRRAYPITIFHVPLLCTSISTTSIRCNHAVRSKPLYFHHIFSITMEARFSVVNSLLLPISSKGEFDISRQTFHFSNWFPFRSRVEASFYRERTFNVYSLPFPGSTQTQTETSSVISRRSCSMFVSNKRSLNLYRFIYRLCICLIFLFDTCQLR